MRGAPPFFPSRRLLLLPFANPRRQETASLAKAAVSGCRGVREAQGYRTRSRLRPVCTRGYPLWDHDALSDLDQAGGEAFGKIPDNLITFACLLLQSFAVKDRHLAALIPDQAGLLQGAGNLRDARAAYPQHH